MTYRELYSHSASIDYKIDHLARLGSKLLMSSLFHKVKQFVQENLDFQGRVWVVNVFEGPHKGESFIVNEDSFQRPYQWMKNKGYSDEMIAKIDSMARSQVSIFNLGEVKHRLMRVK